MHRLTLKYILSLGYHILGRRRTTTGDMQLMATSLGSAPLPPPSSVANPATQNILGKIQVLFFTEVSHAQQINLAWGGICYLPQSLVLNLLWLQSVDQKGRMYYLILGSILFSTLWQNAARGLESSVLHTGPTPSTLQWVPAMKHCDSGNDHGFSGSVYLA